MPFPHSARRGVMALGALGALALGGSQLAAAASSTSSSSSTPAASSTSSSSGTPSAASTPPAGRPQRDATVPGGHVGANGKTEAALPADVAAKVKAAALAKVPGATIERVETDVDHGSPYEAHMKKADGSELEVLVDSSFQVTAVNTMGHR